MNKADSDPATHVDVRRDRPSLPFTSFAVLEDAHGGTLEQINQRLVRKAMQIGADAIVIFSINNRTTTEWRRDDPAFGTRGAYHPRYRPVKFVYRNVRARAVPYRL